MGFTRNGTKRENDVTNPTLETPLSEIELAELFSACSDVLTPAGMLLLRRLAFERGRLLGKTLHSTMNETDQPQ